MADVLEVTAYATAYLCQCVSLFLSDCQSFTQNQKAEELS